LARQEFEQAWTAMKEVYGQTRFVSYPTDYARDRYFHLASQREDLTWMIQAQELYLAMIDQWMQPEL
jgi:hypothetical protein